MVPTYRAKLKVNVFYRVEFLIGEQWSETGIVIERPGEQGCKEVDVVQLLCQREPIRAIYLEEYIDASAKHSIRAQELVGNPSKAVAAATQL